MCGIVGYIGKRQAAPILMAGLNRLEYRGYDSAGIAIANKGALRIAKRKGRVRELDELKPLRIKGTSGIAHTRWATNGEPSDRNAHPHSDSAGRYKLQGIPPGNYRAFAWEDVERDAWQDPEFLGLIEGRGTTVQVSEGIQADTDLIVIPAVKSQ